MQQAISIFWFRRDLRISDNAALYYALKSEYPVLPIFIFDTEILNKLEDKDDARVHFIHKTILKLNSELKMLDTCLLVKFGSAQQIWEELINTYNIKEVYTNHDYEPYAIKRDTSIASLLSTHTIKFNTYKDQVIFEKGEVLKDDKKPYTVFTPYKNKWIKNLNDYYFKSYPTQKYYSNFLKAPLFDIPTLKSIGFQESTIPIPEKKYQSVMKEYAEKRDYPGIKGTSLISIHLRFGTVSIRELVQNAIAAKADTWLNELIWREFYFMILWNFPHVTHSAFKPEYDRIKWRTNDQEFQRWCNGNTGYPIVDAGMRELNSTGFMHNRVRMIVASFLTKHLLIDWRWGEAYFARKLLDFELSSNNGGWQWVAGSGCDAAPYFRIFNPYEQTKKFDPHHLYIKKWVPEYMEFSYPLPIVDHKYARERCLKAYKMALNGLK
ncbi:cryptochrome/photolyase family protein [Solitalea lacus]|uniref:cryptochrome/photolyase family protein n=1 Tax=Solitalea lacus TaxID=2911172 RepID=UPI001EDBFB0C|nr:deoxyribodipyrimidine photo-lyase [Solitalea lacus]UKJ07195.1 DNA photolyase family protein [Solitalea lacus]